MIGIWATYKTHTGALGPVPATGKQVDFSFGDLYRVEDGKLAESWVTWDNMAIMGQLGLLLAS